MLWSSLFVSPPHSSADENGLKYLLLSTIMVEITKTNDTRKSSFHFLVKVNETIRWWRGRIRSEARLELARDRPTNWRHLLSSVSVSGAFLHRNRSKKTEGGMWTLIVVVGDDIHLMDPTRSHTVLIRLASPQPHHVFAFMSHTASDYLNDEACKRYGDMMNWNVHELLAVEVRTWISALDSAAIKRHHLAVDPMRHMSIVCLKADKNRPCQNTIHFQLNKDLCTQNIQ